MDVFYASKTSFYNLVRHFIRWNADFTLFCYLR